MDASHIMWFLVYVSSESGDSKDATRKGLMQNQIIFESLVDLIEEPTKGFFEQLTPSGKCHELVLFFPGVVPRPGCVGDVQIVPLYVGD